MTRRRFDLVVRNVPYLISAIAILFIASCGEQTTPQQGSTSVNSTVATGSDVNSLPKRGKQTLAAPPAKAVFGMIYINSTDNREYIFDGAEWVPHDNTVDAHYRSKIPAKTVAMTQDDVCVDGDPSCTPNGAHQGHSGFVCQTCHKVGGRLSFSKTTSPTAYAFGKPTPTYDATSKTCSNIACHGVPAGSYSFYSMDGSGEPVLVTVNYGGNTQAHTPSWTGTTGGCAACHDDPPRNGSDGSNVWHSGFHGNQGPTGARNQCQFCHPDASSPGNGIGDTITNPSLHTNGQINVVATFTSACFGCH